MVAYDCIDCFHYIHVPERKRFAVFTGWCSECKIGTSEDKPMCIFFSLIESDEVGRPMEKRVWIEDKQEIETISLREKAIESFAKNASIYDIAYLVQMIDRSKIINYILDILAQLNIISIREIVYLTGFNQSSINKSLTKLHNIGLIKYEMKKGNHLNHFKIVKQWSYVL